MTANITLTWDNGSSEHVDQIVYRSTETFTSNNLPPILARVGRNAREYIDTDIVTGNVYFYAVASENAAEEVLLSSVISVTAGVSTGDPHWDNVVALLQFNDSLADDKGHVFTATSGISYESSPFGSAAVFTGNNYLTSPHSADFSLGNVFTIELFVTVNGATSTATPALGVFVGKNSKIPANDWEFGYVMRPSDTYSITSHDRPTGGLRLDSEVNSLRFPVGVMAHIAMASDGTTTRLFHNGQVVASGSNVSGGMVSSDGSLYIGAFQYSQWHHRLQGAADAIRITKGVARYTENFTPPTEPFPNY